MKQKFSTIFILLLLFFAGSRVVAQNAPKPFDIEQPSLRVFLPAPELATGRAVVACPGGGYSHLAFEHEGCVLRTRYYLYSIKIPDAER